MRNVITALVTGGAVWFSGAATAIADGPGETHSSGYGYAPHYGFGGSHGRLHDDLEHRQFHRELGHREAHRYPMNPWQHGRLHDDLDHDAYHDRLDHRSYHRDYRPSYGRFGYGGFGHRGIGYGRQHHGYRSGLSFWFGR